MKKKENTEQKHVYFARLCPLKLSKIGTRDKLLYVKCKFHLITYTSKECQVF